MMSRLNISRSMPGIFIALLSTMVGMAVHANASERPRMVIGIVIDGLDQQYIDLLQNQFVEGGFNRLLRDGAVITAADYGTNTDATASTAMLMTGASPSVTSISGERVYDRHALRPIAALSGPDGVFSPEQLGVSTLADEVRISSGGVGRVFGIATDPSLAVILAGHSANAAIWLNDRTGAWTSSSFYREVPPQIAYRNRLRPLSLRLDTTQWSPLLPAEAYGLPEHLTHYPFRYTFGGGNPHRYAMFANSPVGNTEIADLAGEIIDNLGLGTTESTDMVNLAFSLKPYDFTTSTDNRYELIDSYLRLDRDLEHLFQKADSVAGPQNAVIFVAATPPSGRSRRDDERWLIPYGEFSTKKAKSLLNMFLIARYGNGEWVTGFFNRQFFLNDQLIEERSVDARRMRAEAADFLEKMSGVGRVITIDEVLGGRGDDTLEALQRNTAAGTAGDLYIEVAPGWETIDDINSPVSENRTRYVERYAAPTASVYILAHDIAPQRIDTPVDIRVVAPTVARLLRIRSPNAASMPALPLSGK